MWLRPIWLRKRIKRTARLAFEAVQRAGLDVLPRHFYSNVPDIRELRATQHWRRPHDMAGVVVRDVDAQLASAEAYLRTAPADVWERAKRRNGVFGFDGADARLLHGFLATERPSRLVQIGAGVSTAIAIEARETFGFDMPITCIDPYPTRLLRELAARNEIELLAQPAQTVPQAVFDALGPGDMLFVDATHAVKPGSEVNRIVLDVLPRFGGSWVAFHDVLWPYDHAPGLLTDDVFFWAESALLHAFLVGNDRFEVFLSASMARDADPERLQRALPDLRLARCESGLVQTDGAFPSLAFLRVRP